MLPSTIYLQSALLVGIQYVINANAAPSALGASIVVDVDADVHLTLDIPQYIHLGTRFAGPEPEPVQVDQPQILPRAKPLSAGQKKALDLHNAARAEKNLQPLVWDDALWKAASVYAKQMAKSGVFAHSASNTRPGQGENLGYAWSSGKVKMPIVVATNGWLAEKSNYNGEAIPGPSFEKYGHYTQIMWSTTLKVGLATAYNSTTRAWYTVARYSPAGNIYGQKPY